MSFPRNRLFSAILEKQTEVAEQTFELVFRVEKNTSFSFEAGQYLWIDVGDRASSDPHGSRRAYSFASAPGDLPLFSILLRASPSPHKKALLALAPGEVVSAIGPFGSTFCLPENDDLPVVALSGGVGIAPFLSLLRHKKHMRLKHAIHLLVENSKKSRAGYKEEILSYAGRSIVGGISWSDIEGIPRVRDALFYVSGPAGMVDRIHDLLASNGIYEEKMRFEATYPTPKGHVALSGVDFKVGDRESTIYQGHPNEVFRIAVEGTSQHLIITDTNGTIVYANKGAERVTGFTQGELLGQTPRLWGGLMGKEFYKKLWETKLKGGTVVGEMINRRKDGSLYNALFHITPIFNHDKVMIGYVATEEDISERVELENRRRETETLLKAVVDNIPNAIFVKDATDLKYIFMNKAGEKLLGVSDTEIKGKTDREAFENRAFGALGPTSVSEILHPGITEQEIDSPEGQKRIVLTKTIPLHDSENQLSSVLGISEDVTDQRRAEKEREQRVEELRQMNKNLVGRELKMIELKEEIDRLKKDEDQV